MNKERGTAMGEISTISAAGLPIHPSNASMPAQVFLGGACGETTWRTDLAIPLLERAGISYFNPQLAPGAWTPDCQQVRTIGDRPRFPRPTGH